MKNILKEISIFVLIIAAIILVLSVLLYDYIPTSKVVPQTISYTTPENLKAEIKEEIIEDNKEVIITYEIDSTDLKEYQNTSSYVPGKQNPFAAYSGETPSNTNGGTGEIGGNGGSNGTSGGQGTNGTVSDEEFFNNNKTK